MLKTKIEEILLKTAIFWLLTQGSRVRFPALPDFSEQQWVWNGVHSAS
jgi:hypothetical protein